MVEDILVKKVNDKKTYEEEFDPSEIDLYSKWVHEHEPKCDDDKIAEDLYEQLIDQQEE